MQNNGRSAGRAGILRIFRTVLKSCLDHMSGSPSPLRLSQRGPSEWQLVLHGGGCWILNTPALCWLLRLEPSVLLTVMASLHKACCCYSRFSSITNWNSNQFSWSCGLVMVHSSCSLLTFTFHTSVLCNFHFSNVCISAVWWDLM